jgi:hypothetical protein
VLWLIAGSIALVALRKNERIYAYGRPIFLWSSVGLLAANVVLILEVVRLLFVMGDAPEQRNLVRDGLQLTVGLGAILGPFIASVLSWLAGAAFGAFRAHRRRGIRSGTIASA